MDATATITILASRDEVAERWRSFFREGGGDSRLGGIEIDGDEPGGALRWHTSEDANARATGTTRFAPAPGDRGTEVHMRFDFQVAGGVIGAAARKVAGSEPQQLVRDDLRRLKQLVETGEIARSDGAPVGHDASLQPKQRPAQPLEHAHA